MSALVTAPSRRTNDPGRHRSPAPRPPRRTRPPSRRLRVVGTTAPRRSLGGVLCAVVAGFVLVTGIIGIVALNALAAEASFQAMELEEHISDLTLRHDNLVAEVAMLEAPARVREVATTRLGLIDPAQPGFLVIPDRSNLDDGDSDGTGDVGAADKPTSVLEK